MKTSLKLLLCIIIPLAIGAVSGVATASSIDTWYVHIEKPTFNPPNYLFGPVWTTLYVLMGISFFMIIYILPPQTRLNLDIKFIFRDIKIRCIFLII